MRPTLGLMAKVTLYSAAMTIASRVIDQAIVQAAHHAGQEPVGECARVFHQQLEQLVHAGSFTLNTKARSHLRMA